MKEKFLISLEQCHKTYSYFFSCVFESVHYFVANLEQNVSDFIANLVCFMLKIKVHLQTDSDNDITSL